MLKNILPVGSVVRLHGGQRSVMIIGIMQQHEDQKGNIGRSDYMGVPYPVGYLHPDLNFCFDNSDVEEVLFRGYDDNEEYKDFIKSLDLAQTLNDYKKELEFSDK